MPSGCRMDALASFSFRPHLPARLLVSGLATAEAIEQTTYPLACIFPRCLLNVTAMPSWQQTTKRIALAFRCEKRSFLGLLRASISSMSTRHVKPKAPAKFKSFWLRLSLPS